MNSNTYPAAGSGARGRSAAKRSAEASGGSKLYPGSFRHGAASGVEAQRRSAVTGAGFSLLKGAWEANQSHTLVNRVRLSALQPQLPSINRGSAAISRAELNRSKGTKQSGLPTRSPKGVISAECEVRLCGAPHPFSVGSPFGAVLAKTLRGAAALRRAFGYSAAKSASKIGVTGPGYTFPPIETISAQHGGVNQQRAQNRLLASSPGASSSGERFVHDVQALLSGLVLDGIISESEYDSFAARIRCGG